MDIKKFSSMYEVKKLNENDLVEMLKLCKGNPMFYRFCPPQPTKEGLMQDMVALPVNKTMADKFFVGFFLKKTLVAICDLITGYPQNRTVFIGFFMMNMDYQGKGLGSKIIQELCEYLKTVGFEKVELAYVKGNNQSLNFWLKQGFVLTGQEKPLEDYTKVLMAKIL